MSKTPGENLTLERTAFAMNSVPSERAEAWEIAAEKLPDHEALQLLHLLGFHMRRKTVARVREARLGLLVEIMDHTGQVPTSTEYDQACKDRAQKGQEWPGHQDLCRAYVDWIGAVKAAARHIFDTGARGGVPSSYGHSRVARDEYLPHEIIDAIIRCRDGLGPWPTIRDWPSERDYFAWAEIQRRLAWDRTDEDGVPVADPRLPSRKSFFKKYPSYERAVSVAIARIESGR